MGVYGRTASLPSKSSFPPPSLRPLPGAFSSTQAQTGSESDCPSGKPNVKTVLSWLYSRRERSGSSSHEVGM